MYRIEHAARRRATALVGAFAVMLALGATSAAAKNPRHARIATSDAPVIAVSTTASATVSYSDSVTGSVSYDD